MNYENIRELNIEELDLKQLRKLENEVHILYTASLKLGLHYLCPEEGFDVDIARCQIELCRNSCAIHDRIIKLEEELVYPIYELKDLCLDNKLRLGQLISIVFGDKDLFYISNSDFIEQVTQKLSELKK
jgi:hypothetical protein